MLFGNSEYHLGGENVVIGKNRIAIAEQLKHVFWSNFEKHVDRI